MVVTRSLVRDDGTRDPRTRRERRAQARAAKERLMADAAPTGIRGEETRR